MKGQDIKYVALKSQAEAKVSCLSSSYRGHILVMYGSVSRNSCRTSGCATAVLCSGGCLPLQKVERLQRSLHFIGAPQQSRHTVFLDGEEAPSFSPQHHFDTPAELLGRSYNRPRNEQLSSALLVSSSDSKRLDR